MSSGIDHCSGTGRRLSRRLIFMGLIKCGMQFNINKKRLERKRDGNCRSIGNSHS